MKYKTLEDYIRAEYGEIKFKRGRWYILLAEGGDEGHQLWHKCEKDSWELEIVQYYAFSEYANRPIKPNWRCEICFKEPPESILGVWCLLEPDATSEEVQDVLREEERRKKEEEEYQKDPHKYMTHYVEEYGGGWGHDMGQLDELVDELVWNPLKQAP